jgi:thiol-disulfide isomerase/thioredoxin
VRPNVRDYNGVVGFYKKRGTAVVEAADKLLAAQPTDEQAEKAIQAKLSVLVMLAQLGDKDALTKLEALVGELTKTGRTKLARHAKGVLLTVKLSRVRDAKSEEFLKLVEEVRKHLSEAPVERTDVSLIMTLPRVAEFAGNPELAGRLYNEFAKVLAASQDEQVAGIAKRMEGAARRVDLLGKPMRLEGTKLDGSAFDWSKYRGKVVLVDFWATWCGPCRAEMPNVKKAYGTYHDRGFDVVGLSLDRDLKALEKYVQEEQVPWAILLDHPAILNAQAATTNHRSVPETGETAKSGESKKPGAATSPEFMADYYGVLAIPTTLLVDKDGKVVSLSARGEQLQKHLKDLLGPAEPPKDAPKTPSATSH